MVLGKTVLGLLVDTLSTSCIVLPNTSVYFEVDAAKFSRYFSYNLSFLTVGNYAVLIVIVLIVVTTVIFRWPSSILEAHSEGSS